ncbi:MAG: preprotein translocase subunit YajC [Alphaproteobacteria bacterium]|nr:preprotein translocase subunit YajC [Alphaproteobacteria bacterium]MDX5464992.1 preprotein translocase subunit YajC [Alphaproteobacteria bacterium]
MFVTPAYAQAAGGGGADAFLLQLPFIIAIIAIFYFLLIRPQQKRMKEHRAKIEAVRRGDKIVTGGGILAKVTKVVDEGELEVELADGVRVRIVRSTIADVVSKGEPAEK